MNRYRIVAQAYDGRIFDLGEGYSLSEADAIDLALDIALSVYEPEGFVELHRAGEIADISAHEV